MVIYSPAEDNTDSAALYNPIIHDLLHTYHF